MTKVEITDVRPIKAATAKGALETRHLIYFRVDDGPTQTIEVPGETLSQDDALAAIKAHLAFKGGIVGQYEL